MSETTIAVSTNDYKQLSNDPFGQSHFFIIYRLHDGELKQTDVRENVLFRQTCDIQGRVEHLHGLLGDITYLVGKQFEPGVKHTLEDMGYEIVELQTGSLEQLANRLHELKVV